MNDQHYQSFPNSIQKLPICSKTHTVSSVTIHDELIGVQQQQKYSLYLEIAQRNFSSSFIPCLHSTNSSPEHLGK